MFYAGFALGAVGVFLYFRFGNRVYALGEELIHRADGDFKAAYTHVRNFAVAVASDVEKYNPF